MTFSTFASPGVGLQGGGGSGGGGTASLPISGNGATITTSTPLINGTQTWNSGATTFTSLLLNVTDTASAAASLLMDLQVGGTSRFSVGKTGGLTFAGNLQVANNGVYIEGTVAGTVRVPGVNGYFGFTTNTSSTSGSIIDLFLTRRAAANLRLGAADVGATTSTVTITIAAPGVVTWTGHGFSTGTPVVFTTTGALPTGITAGTTYYAVVVDANTFQIASSAANAIAAVPTVITTSGTQSGTHTGTRYNITQRLGMQSVTGVTDRLGADLIIQGSQGTGTGAGGSIVFQVAPAGLSGTAQNALATAWSISGASHFLAGADNSYDIGASGANRPRSIYTASGVVFANSLAVNSGSAYTVLWNSGQLGWASSATVATNTNPDTGLKRSAAAIVAVTNGSTGGGAVELQEMTAPAAPATNNVRIYAEDNGSGKTRLMALFPTGAAVQIAIEP